MVDDGSTDNTRELLEPYTDRIRYIFQENQKYSGARNTGIRAATGEYLAFLDSDDVWLPDKLAKQVAALDAHPQASLVYSQVSYIDADGKPARFCGQLQYGGSSAEVAVSDPTRDLLFGSVVLTPSIAMVRRCIIEEVGPLDSKLTYAEDRDLWRRVARKGPFIYLPEVLAYYRVFGWEKVLKREASDQLIVQPLSIVERALASWPGDAAEVEPLRKKANATLYIRAALASYQLGQGSQGRAQLERAIDEDPGLGQREPLIDLAADRARLIQADSGSINQSIDFINTFFNHLPPPVLQHRAARQEAVARLYVGNAFEQYQAGNMADVRRMLRKAVAHSPACLRNRGVVSMAVEAWAGSTIADRLRQAGRGFLKLAR